MSPPSTIIQGIVLQGTAFKEKDVIFSIFSPDGRLSLIAKGANRNNQGFSHLLCPLTHAEFVVQKRGSELLRCQEAHPIHLHLDLRSDLKTLTASCDAINAIKKSQLHERSAPLLFDLLVYTLNRMRDVEDPFAFAASFRLKIVRYEGLWDFSQDNERMNGLTKEEEEIVRRLALSTSFEKLKKEKITEELLKKIQLFFDYLLE